MTITLLSQQSPVVQLQDHFEYPEAGVLSKLLFKDEVCQVTLFCLASGTEIAEHTASRNATVHVIDGNGTLTLRGEDIPLKAGVFLFMPAHAPHALQATTKLAFVLTLSAPA